MAFAPVSSVIAEHAHTADGKYRRVPGFRSPELSHRDPTLQKGEDKNKNKNKAEIEAVLRACQSNPRLP